MNFTKMQGAGNDFILIESDDSERNWLDMAKNMCHRRFGIGADGLLLLLPSKSADFRMRIFNSDGSEAEMCGNGIRCLAKYIVESGLVDIGIKEMSVETMSGIRRIKLSKSEGRLTEIQAGMGKPDFVAHKIPVLLDSKRVDSLDIINIINYPVTIKNRELLLSFISMGNPHAVYFYDQPISDFPLSEMGPEVEKHGIFPNRINFEVARIMSRNLIHARVWERGAGETLACGTGACAIAVAAQVHGYVDNKVDIMLPGGLLNIEWDGVEEVLLSGPAEIVFTGSWPE
ncbi:diaminopimelate epimerase [Chloroflexota bacterium]